MLMWSGAKGLLWKHTIRKNFKNLQKCPLSRVVLESSLRRRENQRITLGSMWLVELGASTRDRVWPLLRADSVENFKAEKRKKSFQSTILGYLVRSA